jgi:hypothetical protein
MSRLDVLEMLSRNNYKEINDFILGGADLNQVISGKSLLAHSVLLKSNQAINLLLLYGANTADMQKIKDWKDRLATLDTAFLDMVNEINSNPKQGEMVVQIVMNESSKKFVKGGPFSYRNVLSFSDPDRDYKKISAGLHIFECRDIEYLQKILPTLLYCNFDFNDFSFALPAKKYALIISTCPVGDLRNEVPSIPQRIRGFINFVEVPIEILDDEICEMENRNETILGVRFSDRPCLAVNPEGVVDLNFRDTDFKESKETYTAAPIIKASVYTFTNLLSWDHQLNEWVKAFKMEHGYFPNILLASSATYSRIDLIVNARGRDHLHNPEGLSPSEEEFISMSGFKGNGYDLNFCIEDQLGIDTVKLIYDSDPDGGLPIPEEDEISTYKAG